MKAHEIKIEEQFFRDIKCGKKKFEIRYNDRNYQVGDDVLLKEITNHSIYTGRELLVEIIYITSYQQKDGFVVWGFEEVEE